MAATLERVTELTELVSVGDAAQALATRVKRAATLTRKEKKPLLVALKRFEKHLISRGVAMLDDIVEPEKEH